MPNNSGTDLRYDKYNVYHSTMLTARYQPIGVATEERKAVS